MRTRWLTACLVIFMPAAHAGFLSGAELVQAMRQSDRLNAGNPAANTFAAGSYRGYVIGIYDALSAGGALCPPAGTTLGEVVETASAYLETHPAQWDMSAATLVQKALLTRFSCRRR